MQMVGHKERAEEYRLKAEELRSLMPDMTDKHTRELLEKIAADYDQLAVVGEGFAESEKAGAKL